MWTQPQSHYRPGGVRAGTTGAGASGRQTNCASPLYRKLICGDCGEFYGSKVWHSTSRTLWQCNAKFHNEQKCRTPHLYEDDLKQHFITALSELLTDRTALLEDGRLLRQELLDFSEIEAKQQIISRELSIIAELIRRQITENAAREQSQTAYTERYDSLAARSMDIKLFCRAGNAHSVAQISIPDRKHLLCPAGQENSIVSPCFQKVTGRQA